MNRHKRAIFGRCTRTVVSNRAFARTLLSRQPLRAVINRSGADTAAIHNNQYKKISIELWYEERMRLRPELDICI